MDLCNAIFMKKLFKKNKRHCSSSFELLMKTQLHASLLQFLKNLVLSIMNHKQNCLNCGSSKFLFVVLNLDSRISVPVPVRF